jgi:hypothetical protein
MKRVLTSLVGVLVVGGLTACKSDNGLDRLHSSPSVEIRSPAGGTAFRQGDGPIDFEGIVTDAFDGSESLVITWWLGEGDELELVADEDGSVSWTMDPDVVELGDHEITLRGVDTDGDIGEDDTYLKILAPMTAPLVAITDPVDGDAFEEDDVVTFQGEASDDGTEPGDLVFAWESSLDGVLDGAVSGDGRSIVVAEDLSIGTHDITLQAIDPDGEVGLDFITITVGLGDVESPVEDAEPGDLVFSEMMVNPEIVDDDQGEWVELYNTSGSTIDVTGYTFRDDDVDGWILEGPLTVGPGEYLVLCANTSSSENGGVPCDGWFYRDYEGNGLALANKQDELVLARPDGEEIDWLQYDEDWFTTAVATGVDPEKLELGANNDGANWCDQTTVMTSGGEPGTPGIENDGC